MQPITLPVNKKQVSRITRTDGASLGARRSTTDPHRHFGGLERHSRYTARRRAAANRDRADPNEPSELWSATMDLRAQRRAKRGQETIAHFARAELLPISLARSRRDLPPTLDSETRERACSRRCRSATAAAPTRHVLTRNLRTRKSARRFQRAYCCCDITGRLANFPRGDARHSPPPPRVPAADWRGEIGPALASTEPIGLLRRRTPRVKPGRTATPIATARNVPFVPSSPPPRR